MESGTLEGLPDRLARVYERVESAGGDPGRIKLVAVTKGFGMTAVTAALDNGLADIGENYAQELLSKAGRMGAESSDVDDVSTSARWHFLGAIQRNKVRSLASVVKCWQGVARRVEAEEISRWAPGAEVMVQVLLDSAGTRNGCRAPEVPDLVRSLADLDVNVIGLMAVAPADPTMSRDAFRAVRELADDLELVERSMGMTSDLEDAVKEGATMVRVGTALFGCRPDRGGENVLG